MDVYLVDKKTQESSAAISIPYSRLPVIDGVYADALEVHTTTMVSAYGGRCRCQRGFVTPPPP